MLRKKVNKGALYVVVILMLVITAGLFILGGTPSFNPDYLPPDPTAVQPKDRQQETQPGLQLQTLEFQDITPSPEVQTQPITPIVPPSDTTPQTPTSDTTNYCQSDTGAVKPADCKCPHLTITCSNHTLVNADVAITTDYCDGHPDGIYCVAKPVIYLYPTKPTLINVTLMIPGIITQSIPTYPKTGWQYVLAQPNGILSYHGKTYNELYYEDAVQTIHPPTTGVVIPNYQLRFKLIELTTQIGLLPSEQQEFLEYWLPKLQALHAPYMLFSVLDPQEKDRIDHVEITPKPDTLIEFLAYFKPLQAPIATVNPLLLPPTPKRIGFTAVEWGGTIDLH